MEILPQPLQLRPHHPAGRKPSSKVNAPSSPPVMSLIALLKFKCRKRTGTVPLWGPASGEARLVGLKRQFTQKVSAGWGFLTWTGVTLRGRVTLGPRLSPSVPAGACSSLVCGGRSARLSPAPSRGGGAPCAPAFPGLGAGCWRWGRRARTGIPPVTPSHPARAAFLKLSERARF